MFKLIYMTMFLVMFINWYNDTYELETTYISNNDLEQKKMLILKNEEVTEIDLLDSNSITVIVNKNRSLNKNYEPEDLVVPNVSLAKNNMLLRSEAAQAIETMFKEAEKDNIHLLLASAYRSYEYQFNLYNNYVNRDGEEEANRYSAKPGQSEHQTGLAADIAAYSKECYISSCFANTKEGLWLKDNAHLYGFILRYPQDKEKITGYVFEPWHFRYIGVDEASSIYYSQLTMEEYYGLLNIH